MTTGLWIIGGVILAAVLVGACLTRHPVRALFRSALEGICALGAVNIAGMFTGVTLGVTTFSATVCAVLGIPGAVSLLVMQVLIR